LLIIFKLETFSFDHKNLDPDSVNLNLGSLATPVCYCTAWLQVKPISSVTTYGEKYGGSWRKRAAVWKIPAQGEAGQAS
jgi:hypothetical protein